MKKLLCTLLTISMALSLLIGLAIGVSAQTGSTIEEAAITGLKAPIYGEAFNASDFTIPDDANYELEIEWEYFDDELEEYVTTTSGTYGYKSYTLHITITPKEGYTLNLGDDGGMPTINGTAINQIQWVEGEGYMLEGWESERDWSGDEEEFYYYLHATVEPENGWISDVETTGRPDEIVVGQAITAPTITLDEGYENMTVDKVQWLDANKAPITGKFEANKVYYLAISVKADQGYGFPVDMDSVSDGRYAETTVVNEDGTAITGYYRYSLLPTVNKVELTVPVPAAGAVPGAVTLPAGANYQLNAQDEDPGYFWREDNDDDVTQFEKGKVYILSYELTPKDGYDFAEGVEIWLNGELVTNYHGATTDLSYENRFSLKTQISRVEITLPDYKMGDIPTAADVQLPANANYKLQHLNVSSVLHDTDWSDGLKKDRYAITVALEPNDGCEFTKDAVYYINGTEVESDYFLYDWVAPKIEISFCDQITSVAFPALPTVKAGDTVGSSVPIDPNFKAPEGTNYELKYVWMEPDDIYLSTYEGTIQAVGNYWLRYYAVPKEGYEFAEAVKATVAGVETEMFSIDIGEVTGLKQQVLGLKIIDKLELITNPFEIGGAVGKITVPADANYVLQEMLWGMGEISDLSEAELLAETDVFEKDKNYLLMAYLVPKDGYVFSQDMVITVNGQRISSQMPMFWDSEVLPTNGEVAFVYYDVGRLNEEVPPTGDDAQLSIVVTMAMLSAGALVALGLKKKEF